MLQELGNYVFESCSSLKKAEIEDLADNIGIHTGLFNFCNEMEELDIWENEPPQLVLFAGIGYRFNVDWTQEE